MEKKLQRDTQNKMLGGVASGLADYFDVEVTWVRLAFVLTVFAGLAGVPVYIVLWIVVPAKRFNPFQSNYPPPAPDYRVYEDKAYTAPPASGPSPFAEEYVRMQAKKENNGKLIAGLILILIGSIFLFRQLDILPYWFSFRNLWPLALILPGIAILLGGFESRRVYEPTPTEAPKSEPTSEPSDNQPTV